MIGPVGAPVGDPPGGSSETASVASEVRRPASSGGDVEADRLARLHEPERPRPGFRRQE